MKKFAAPGLLILSLLTFGCSRGPSAEREYRKVDTAEVAEIPDTRSNAAPTVKKDYIHKYGVPLSSNDWEKRGGDGQIIATREDGVVVTQSFRGGLLHGETTYTFPHSSVIAKTERFYNGVMEEETWSYTSGMPARKDLSHSNGYLSRTTWYENGTPKSQEKFLGNSLVSGDYYDKENNLESQVANGNGMRKRWDAYGQLISTEEIQNGLLVSATEYHPSGTPKSITPYQNNLVHGTKRTFLPGGEPNTVEEWAQGKQHGTTVHYRNGMKTSELTFVNGERHGMEKRFRDDAELVEEIAWSHNNRHGPSRNYIGNDTQISWFHQGRQVSENTYDELNPSSAIR